MDKFFRRSQCHLHFEKHSLQVCSLFLIRHRNKKLRFVQNYHIELGFHRFEISWRKRTMVFDLDVRRIKREKLRSVYQTLQSFFCQRVQWTWQAHELDRELYCRIEFRGSFRRLPRQMFSCLQRWYRLQAISANCHFKIKVPTSPKLSGANSWQ